MPFFVFFFFFFFVLNVTQVLLPVADVASVRLATRILDFGFSQVVARVPVWYQ